MFRNVLVGYDGGETSQDALALGRVLAGSLGTVTAACTYWWQPLSARVVKSRPGQMRMRAGAEEVLAGLEDPSVLTVPAPGTTPAHALADLIDDRGCDAVVVGSTHRGRAGKVLAGTTADALLRHGGCPVAVAPRGYRDGPRALRRIGVAHDSSDASHGALALAADLATDREAELVVLRADTATPALTPGVKERARAELDDAVARVQQAEVVVAGELLEGDPIDVLLTRAADLDLLVVGSGGHGALGRIVVGSVSHRLMCESLTPVLAVPPE